MDRLQAVAAVLCFVCMSTARTRHVPFVSSKAPRELIHNYEIVKPFTVQHGSSTNELVVYIQSDSVKYTLHLALNVGLLSSKFTSTFHTEDGTQQIQKGHTNCFYHGTVVEQPNWRVAMSTCQGLRGSFGPPTDLSQHYHIEPLNSSLASPQLDQLHVLYLGSEYSEQGGTCGTKGHNGGMPQPHHIALDRQKLRRQLTFAIVEWTLVIDHAQFLQYSKNLTAVVLRSLEIANGVDLIYKEEGVRLAVVDVVTWTVSDPIEVVEDPDVLLDTFREYTPNLPQNYDSVMLFTGISFTGSTIGIAFTGTVCNNQHFSVGLVEDGGRDLSHVISTTAHELGHIFGMNHDTNDCECNDPTQSCIMSATLIYPPPNTWSSCSVETLQTSLGGSLSRCLNNEPLMTVTDPSCGNGIQEEGEECDCGTEEECIDPCCNAVTCQLELGAKCRAGQCCQPDCQFKPYGTICRNVSSECDIAEYCTGDMADCPRDVYRQDLTFCKGNSSYCFSGHCNTRDSQCMEHFRTESAVDECYTDVNTRGTVNGHCGHNNTHYIPCETKNAFCGQIQCVPGTLQTTTGFRTTVTIFVAGGQHTCRSVTTSIGSDQVSPGLIRDGTTCGDEMICLSSKCVSTSDVNIKPCPTGRNGEVCSGQGLCNSDDECSCFVDFRGAACDGFHSSGDNAGKIAGAVIGVLLVLAIIVGVVVAVSYLVWRSKSAKYIARRYIPRTTTKGTAQGTEKSLTHVYVKRGSASVTSQSQSRTQLQPPNRSAPPTPPQPSSNGRPPPPAHRPPPPTSPAAPPTRPPTRPPLPPSKPPTTPSRPASKPLPVVIPPPTNRPPPPAPVRTPPSLAKRPPPPPQSKPAPRPAPRTKVGIQWPPPSD